MLNNSPSPFADPPPGLHPVRTLDGLCSLVSRAAGGLSFVAALCALAYIVVR
jgi:hypothetical protein